MVVYSTSQWITFTSNGWRTITIPVACHLIQKLRLLYCLYCTSQWIPFTSNGWRTQYNSSRMSPNPKIQLHYHNNLFHKIELFFRLVSRKLLLYLVHQRHDLKNTSHHKFRGELGITAKFISISKCLAQLSGYNNSE